MIAVFWSDLLGWSAKRGRSSLCLIIGALGIAAGLSALRPEVCLIALLLAVLWLGLSAGGRSWGRVQHHEWILKTGLSPGRVVSGKYLLALAISLLPMIAALPLAVLMVPIWGVPWAKLGWACLLIEVQSCIAAGLGAINNYLDREDEVYLGKVMVGIWLVLTGVVADLRLFNPVAQTWLILTGGATHPIAIILLIHLAMALAVGVLAAQALWREAQRNR